MFEWISELTIQEWGVISSFTFALTSLCIVIYRDFLLGPRLFFTANQIGILRTPGNNKIDLLGKMLAKDLLSQNLSPDAKNLLDNSPEIQQAVDAGEYENLISTLIQYSQNNPVNYDPPLNIFKEATEELDFSLNFFVPISVHNSGKKTGHVRSLVLVIYDKNNESDRWAFTSFILLDTSKVLDRTEQTSDSDRIDGLFAGFSISPNSSHQLTPWFIPISEIDGQKINTKPLSPGEYRVKLFSYNAKGEKCDETLIGEINLELKNYLEFFSGSESINSLNVNDDVGDAIRT